MIIQDNFENTKLMYRIRINLLDSRYVLLSLKWSNFSANIRRCLELSHLFINYFVLPIYFVLVMDSTLLGRTTHRWDIKTHRDPKLSYKEL